MRKFSICVSQLIGDKSDCKIVARCEKTGERVCSPVADTQVTYFPMTLKFLKQFYLRDFYLYLLTPQTKVGSE